MSFHKHVGWIGIIAMGVMMREPETPATVSAQASSQPASGQLAEV